MPNLLAWMLNYSAVVPSAFSAGSFSGFDSWSSFPLSPSCLKTKPKSKLKVIFYTSKNRVKSSLTTNENW